MAMYMCPICGMGVSSGKNHKCEPKLVPFNVFNSKKKDEDAPRISINPGKSGTPLMK